MTSSHAVAIRDVPVPGPLAEVGVRILYDEASNSRIIAIPRAVRERCNVIDPVTSLVQADPNWTPRISVVELDPNPKGPHYYEQAGRKLAPTKQALEVLAKGAGVLSTSTDRIPRADLDDGEIGYRATVRIRRSDGTEEQITREKVWVKEAERAEIEEAVSRAEEWKDGKPVRGSHKFGEPDSPTWKAEVEKRWLKEMKDRYAKTESKAVLRAIRAALQIPHTFTPADAAKPFLVIGFNFTPDYSEPEIRKALVAAGLNAGAQMYGGPVDKINLNTGELTPGEDPADVVETDAAAAAPVDRSPEGAPSDGGGGQQAEGGSGDGRPAAAAPAPGDPAEAEFDWSGLDAEAEPKPEQQTLGGPDLGPQVPGGKFEGQRLADVANTPEGVTWIKTALKRTGQSEPFRIALEAWVEAELPEVWTDYQKSKGS